MCLTKVGLRVGCRRKSTLLSDRDSVVKSVYVFESLEESSCVSYFLTDKSKNSFIWRTKKCSLRYGNIFLSIASTEDLRYVLEVQASGLSHLWHQGLSTALHIQISYILCGGAGVAVLLRYACEEALETTQAPAPDPLSNNGSFGAKRSSEKKTHA